MIPDYLNTSDTDIQRNAASLWNSTSAGLQMALHTAVSKAADKGLIENTKRDKYFISGMSNETNKIPYATGIIEPNV